MSEKKNMELSDAAMQSATGGKYKNQYNKATVIREIHENPFPDEHMFFHSVWDDLQNDKFFCGGVYAVLMPGSDFDFVYATGPAGLLPGEVVYMGDSRSDYYNEIIGRVSDMEA